MLHHFNFFRSYTVSDQAPKRLIMQTLARAAIERDRAFEDEDQGEAVPGQGTPLLNEARMNTVGRRNQLVNAINSPAGSVRQQDHKDSPRYRVNLIIMSS